MKIQYMLGASLCCDAHSFFEQSSPMGTKFLCIRSEKKVYVCKKVFLRKKEDCTKQIKEKKAKYYQGQVRRVPRKYKIDFAYISYGCMYVSKAEKLGSNDLY